MPTATLFALNIDTVYDALRYLSTCRVGNFLVYAFDSGDHEILDLTVNRTEWATTPVKYLRNCALQSLAADAKIVFWGGPPDDCDWYSGSLLAMLVDRLFYNVVTGNHEIVEQFMKAVEHD